jgi:hypothetical protein
MRGNAFGDSDGHRSPVGLNGDALGCGDFGTFSGNGAGGGPLSLPWGGGESPCDRDPIGGDGPWALLSWRG